MSKRLNKLEEYEIDSRTQRKGKNKKVAGGILLCLFIFIFSMQISKSSYKEMEPVGTGNSKNETDTHEVTTEDERWKLVLINTKNPLSKDFRVSLQEIKGGKVDARITKPLLQMIKDAKTDGVTLNVCSAYRSVSKQKSLFNTEIDKYLNQGYSEDESRKLAKQYVNPPGESEHHLGLAIDFLTDSNSQLDESFADTLAYAWLETNSTRYGFIERYPEGKEDVTGINWEPWHYRYVGVKNAKDIVKEGVCLEEYLEE